MIADSFFQQSPQHEVCEDYAMHGDDYVIVADGCSSGVLTDWGSRILANAANEHIGKFLQPKSFLQAISSTALTQQRIFYGLSEQCLLATLLAGRLFPKENLVRTICCGDGIIGGRRRDGRWKIHVVDFDANAPFYLKYTMFPEDIERWRKFVLDILEEAGTPKNEPEYSVTTYFGKIMLPGFEYPDLTTIKDPQEWPTTESRAEMWGESIGITEQNKVWDVENPWVGFDFPIDEYDLVFLSTDGPAACYERRNTGTSKHNENLHIIDVLRVLMDCRSFRPGFLHLQRNWAFKQDRAGTFPKRGWHNGDDISAGAIYCG